MFAMNFSSSANSRPPRFLMTYQSRDEALNPDKHTTTKSFQQPKSATSSASMHFSLPTKLKSKSKFSVGNFMSMRFQSGASAANTSVQQLANPIPTQRKMTSNNTRWTFPFTNNADTLTKMPDNVAPLKKDVHKRKPNHEVKVPFRDYTYKTRDGHMVVGGKKYPIQPMAKKHLDDVPIEDEPLVPKEEEPVKTSTSSLPTFKVTYSAGADKKTDSDSDLDVVTNEFVNDIKRNVVPEFKETGPVRIKPSWES